MGQKLARLISPSIMRSIKSCTTYGTLVVRTEANNSFKPNPLRESA
jgi:hypothetical protein